MVGMTERPVVTIDPDGIGPDWMYVIVQRGTGVWYDQQYGGTACRHGRVEGYLVPVYDADTRRLLDALFIQDLEGTGLWGGARRPDDTIVARVREAVSRVRYWASEPDVSSAHQLALDEVRLVEIDEAWLPVVTPDGPGFLVWPNSD
jgi:hypothetical protein